MITQERLKEVLLYDNIKGSFIWLAPRGRQPKGSIAGYDTKRGYRGIKVDGACYFSHRLAYLYVEGVFPEYEIDHINGDRSDNRYDNLRSVTRSENHMNMGLTTNNSSGRIGVFWNNGKKRWTAKIEVNGKDIFLGHFKEFILASEARSIAEEKYGFHVNHGKRAASSYES